MSSPSSPTLVAIMAWYSPERNLSTVSTCFFCFRPVSPALPIRTAALIPASSRLERMTSTESR